MGADEFALLVRMVEALEKLSTAVAEINKKLDEKAASK